MSDMSKKKLLGLVVGSFMIIAGALLASVGLGWNRDGVEDPALAIGGSLLCGAGVGIIWAARPFGRAPRGKE